MILQPVDLRAGNAARARRQLTRCDADAGNTLKRVSSIFFRVEQLARSGIVGALPITRAIHFCFPYLWRGAALSPLALSVGVSVALVALILWRIKCVGKLFACGGR